MPRTQVPTSTQRRDQKNEEKEGPGSSPPDELEGSNIETSELNIEYDKEEVSDINLVAVEEERDNENDGIDLEVASISKSLFDNKISQFDENGRIPEVDEHTKESKDAERFTKSEEKVTTTGDVNVSIYGRGIEEKQIHTKSSEDQWREKIDKEESVEEMPETVDTGYNSISEDNKKEDNFLKLKLESEEILRKEAVDRLAEDNFKKGNKLFYYPELVKPDQDIEIYFNRSFSTLKNEPDVMIMGAYNGWKWKSFTLKLSKSHLNGDWWSCQVHVPKEAYKIDFVFYNGKDVYENNDKQDFCITVEGGMDVFDFENFLLEEKRREQEEFARQKAERERQAEEQRRIEAEIAANEADRGQAREEAAKRREIVQEIMKKAMSSVDNVWYIEPNAFEGNDMVRLYYNRSSGPLSHANDICIHGGHNGWSDGLFIVSKLIKSEERYGDWWYADGILIAYPTVYLNYTYLASNGTACNGNFEKDNIHVICHMSDKQLLFTLLMGDFWGNFWQNLLVPAVVVPDRALVLDWVFADGPPQQAIIYDNNNLQDFHAIVPTSIPEELYWVEEEQQIYKRLHTERRLREETIRAKAEKTARLKAETKKRTLKTFLLSQKHIVYTDPLDVHAGSTVTVFYNPANTVLNGKPKIWLRCSFNRWTHRLGPLPPHKMIPAENGPHLKATVKVPLDAYMMDFVFSEREDGGIFDNKNGMDYHIPVFGGVVKEPPMHIVHIAVEMAPIAKVGGLGDVVTSLSRAVQDMNHNVDIILPKYDCLNLSNVKDLQFHKSYFWGGTEIKVWIGKVEGLSVYFLEPQNGTLHLFIYLDCKMLLESSDLKLRFVMFSLANAVEETLENYFGLVAFMDVVMMGKDLVSFATQLLSFFCKVDSIHAPVAWLFKEHYVHYGLSKARVVFTIHNLEFGAALIGKAMAFSDKATTVSPTYSQEVSGNPAIAPHLYKFHGILNGIDPDIWDPYNDKFIPVPYTSENVVEGKTAAKEALQQKLGLKRADLPLVVLLGSAPDPRIQNDFVNLANQLHSSHNDYARLCLTYDEPLSHLIYAGADFILVPSIFEPCGLTQLTAMRYGSIPVVRKTGGLYDTVFDVDHDNERAQACGLEPNGFNFDGADAAVFSVYTYYSVYPCLLQELTEFLLFGRAISAWYDGREWFYSLCKRVMEQDWSWNRPALDYLELYHAARK
ncbi:hypothetical protein DH2020_041775 [Rehmannia glutinosa]|uniref:starch synthase n=1 Tax=Rehmannia glutinosa TaxID=99300 RepID=A0ABR0UPB2_REHGL